MRKDTRVLAATGHRPHKLGGYNLATNARLLRLATFYFDRVRPDFVVSGMALGWDTAVAQAAIAAHIPVIAAIPYPEQDARWPPSARERYAALLPKCELVHIVAPYYMKSALQKRNEWMVDNAHGLLALWDGTGGGTGNCVRYALGKLAIDNLWQIWEAGTF